MSLIFLIGAWSSNLQIQRMPNNACSRLGVRAALFWLFSQPWVFPVSTGSPPSHPKRVTRAVGRRGEITESSLESKVELPQHHAHHAPLNVNELSSKFSGRRVVCFVAQQGFFIARLQLRRYSVRGSQHSARGAIFFTELVVFWRRKCFVQASP
jgi:hypothetical protein